MSLINKMLQDLDKRGAAPDPAGGRIREVEPVEMREEPRGRGLLYVGATVVAVTVLVAGYWFLGPKLMRDDRVAMQSVKPAASLPQPAKPTSPPPTSSPATAPENTQPAAVPAKIETPTSAPTEKLAVTAPATLTLQPAEAAKPAVTDAVPEKAPTPGKAAATMPAAKEEIAKASAPAEAKETIPPPPQAAAPKRPPERAVVQAAAPQPVTSDSYKGNISIERQGRPAPPQQRAAVDYRTGLDYMNQGRIDQALATFNDVVSADPRHYAARQAQITLLLERGRTGEAQKSLRDGLAALPENSSWAMLLARLQVEDGDAAGAIDTLKKYAGPAQNRADYQAFIGTVLQMQGKHQEAIGYYEVATRLSPGYGAWLTGLAMSLEEEKRTPEAIDAYKRAYASTTLAPSMRSFVEGKLKQLQ